MLASGTWELIAAIIAGLAAILAALVKLVPSVRSGWLALIDLLRTTEKDVTAARELRASLRELRRIRAVRAVLEQWVPSKGLQRALLFCANNGGEAWKGSGHLYCSNPAQVPGQHEPDTSKLWQDWKVDPYYSDLLGRLLEVLPQRRGLLIVRENGVQGELYEQYERQGTVASVVLPFIWREGGVLWYVSLNFGRYPHLPGKSPPECEIEDEDYKGHHPHTNEQTREYIDAAQSIYSNAAMCRGLTDELRAAYLSAR